LNNLSRSPGQTRTVSVTFQALQTIASPEQTTASVTIAFCSGRKANNGGASAQVPSQARPLAGVVYKDSNTDRLVGTDIVAVTARKCCGQFIWLFNPHTGQLLLPPADTANRYNWRTVNGNRWLDNHCWDGSYCSQACDAYYIAGLIRDIARVPPPNGDPGPLDANNGVTCPSRAGDNSHGAQGDN
jgi:hypothetical protein